MLGLFDQAILRTFKGVYAGTGTDMAEIQIGCRVWLIGELPSPVSLHVLIDEKEVWSGQRGINSLSRCDGDWTNYLPPFGSTFSTQYPSISQSVQTLCFQDIVVKPSIDKSPFALLEFRATSLARNVFWGVSRIKITRMHVYL